MLLREFWANWFWPYCTRNLRESTCVGYEANGTVTMLGNPNSAYAGCTGVWRTADPMPD